MSLKAGHQLVKGPPGSGKTPLSSTAADSLRKYRPRDETVPPGLHNIALASYLKRLLQEKGIGVGEDGVQVFHFYEICQKILGMKVEYDNQDPGYYDTILQLTLEALEKGHPETASDHALSWWTRARISGTIC